MPILSEDNQLRVARHVVERCSHTVFILSLDALLQLQHHGARSIDNLDVVSCRDGIGFGGFAMRSQQHFGIVQRL